LPPPPRPTPLWSPGAQVDVFSTTAYKNFVLGGHVGYDTSKSDITGYTAALGYTAPDAQFACERGEGAVRGGGPPLSAALCGCSLGIK